MTAPQPPQARRPGPGGGEAGPALATVATQHETRGRHPSTRGGGGGPRPPAARGLSGSPLAWSVVIGVLAASAVLWVLLIAALFTLLGEYMRLQADIMSQLGRITISQGEASGYGCDAPYGLGGEDPRGPAGRLGGPS